MLKSLFTLGMSFFLINSFSFAEGEKKGSPSDPSLAQTDDSSKKLSQEKLNELYLNYQSELSKNTNSPLSLYNLALTEMKQGQLGWALAHTEASLYNAPLFNQARGLRAEIVEQIIDKYREPPSEQVSHLFRFLDFIPSLVISLLLSISIFSFLIFSAYTYKKAYYEITNFKREKKIMLISLAFSFAFAPLYIYKLESLNNRWACVVSNEARLLSGPSAEHRFIKSFKEGSCVQVKNKKKGWTAVSTSDGQKGWISSNDLHLARGRKLTVNGSKQ